MDDISNFYVCIFTSDDKVVGHSVSFKSDFLKKLSDYKDIQVIDEKI